MEEKAEEIVQRVKLAGITRFLLLFKGSRSRPFCKRISRHPYWRSCCPAFREHVASVPFIPEKKKACAESFAGSRHGSLSRNCYRELSGGQQQRVLLARALCATKKMMVLDEPVSGLDPKASADMYRTIYRLNRQYGITILMISHDLDLTKRYATHILRVGVPSIHAVKTGGEL